jgi:MFS family permease
VKRAYFALGVLSIINLVNYLDRYILAGVMPHLQKTFDLNDTQGGQLATVFMVVYMCASPAGGFLGDRMPRRLLIGVSVIVWSLATLGSGLAATFGMLLLARAFTGVGEAGYGTVAPSVLSDLFKKEQRSKMLAVFYTAMPLGAAFGFAIGGTMAEKVSWQSAFFAGGVPGLLLGAVAFFMPEPERGAMDEAHERVQVPFVEGLRALAGNARYWLCVAGLTLMTFSIGGLSIWMPKYLSAERGFSSSEAGLALGATTVVGGLVGTLLGGFMGDRLDRRMAGGGVLLSGIGLLAAAPFMVGAVLLQDKAALLICLLLTQICVFLNNGPLNAAIVNVVPSSLRAFAFGISMMVLHLLGDAASPTVIGWISDQSSLGTAILLNAVPVALGGLVLLPALTLFRRPDLRTERAQPAGSTAP